MIPRVAGSGQSFQGAGLYYLNDKQDARPERSGDAKAAFDRVGEYALHDKNGERTAYRVGFTEILNMEAQTPGEAIDQMTASYERYRAKEANKRGRKLTKPVYVYSLAWAPDQNPTQDDMMSAARSSLTALRLEGLQTLIVQHTDEPHPHIHVIVNRIERDGSRARNIAFDQLRFSRWAEQYERDHGGIRCEQRVRNNELRSQGIMTRDTVSLSRAEYTAKERAETRAWEIWRKEQEAFRKETQRGERETLWAKQVGERDALEATTKARVVADRATARTKFQPQWRTLYQRQAVQSRMVAEANRGGIFERACFVMANRQFLAKAGTLRVRDVARLVFSGKALAQRVERIHRGERTALAAWERKLADGAARIAWREHMQDFRLMRTRQRLERDGLAHTQKADAENARAREDALRPQPQALPTPAMSRPELGQGEALAPQEAAGLLIDGPEASRSFNEVSGTPDRADDLMRRMEAFKKRNPKHDFGRRRRM
ncbi:relaxase/mobilization nuclease domain-containing protein [Reyranella aquatilis]|uniref:Relaxase/mobilization nuclease domain-containing protein n=1 Tax=Reyranella aquatilis TaxID=2035356 RepID=A0ABS8KUY7_9HYPH|nr:relaxase/mobilization nuclease domain-containing protein [Reyranella aquatilis]MCC8429889.1 relaxase/mobilization nuclease domain-containing protein [Reyranella aquatilis]